MDFQYDSTRNPPAPFIELSVSDLRGLQQTKISFQLDTGSDFSALPAEVGLLQLPTVDRVTEGAFKPDPRVERRYAAYLEMPGGFSVLTKFLAWDEQYGLAGLDVPNQLRIILDGPRLQLTLEEP